MKRPKGEYAIQTVSNALALLEGFANEEELGVTELSNRLDLHKNNVFRLLATLEQAGYVEQCQRTDRYRLGARCLELGQSFSRNRGLLRQARPLLEELAQETGESIHLGVLRDFEVMHLDGEVADRLVHTGLRVGRRLPAHCTALGKVLLGCAPKGFQESYDRQVVSAGRLEARTLLTITDPSKLLEHLRMVGSQGYAVDMEECEAGLACAAAPIFDASGRVTAAVSVSGPAFRLSTELLLTKAAPLVVSVAERLSQGLGYRPA
jgi:DNA-binding IclR family transcriptional regulator